MRSGVLAVALGASLVGCPGLLKKQDDAGADGATVTVSGTGAKNEASVLRYANETPLATEPAVIGADGAIARNFPGNGPEVATLPKGTPVAKISSYFATGVLIMFDDPAKDGTKLLGWVTPKAFDLAAPPPSPSKMVYVPPRIGDAGSVVVVHDAGTVVIHDAGSVATHDAGGTLPPIPQPPNGTIAVPPTADGRCPQNWSLASGMCRHNCAQDKDCPRGTKCVAKGAVKVCSSGL